LIIIFKLAIDQLGPTEGQTSIESAAAERSVEESSMYELVGSAEGHKNPEAGEIDYESDDSLDGLVDDLPEQQGKVLHVIINIVEAG